jgi:hypothetical protein
MLLTRQDTKNRLHSQTADDLLGQPASATADSDGPRRNTANNVQDISSSIYFRSNDFSVVPNGSLPASPSPLCNYHRYLRTQLSFGDEQQSQSNAYDLYPSAGTDLTATRTSRGGGTYIVGDQYFRWRQLERGSSVRSEMNIVDAVMSLPVATEKNDDVIVDNSSAAAMSNSVVDVTAIRIHRTPNGLVPKPSQLDGLYSFCSCEEPASVGNDFVY